MKRAEQEIPEDPDELPYKSLIQNVDGLEVLCLQMSKGTRVFDNNGVKLEEDQRNQWTAGQFAGHFLLSFSLREWGGSGAAAASGSVGKFYWSVTPVQIKIKRYCTLPQGCKIFETEPELQQELDQRKKVVIKRKIVDEEAVVDFDPDVNELLD
jgi:hypothetical protein